MKELYKGQIYQSKIIQWQLANSLKTKVSHQKEEDFKNIPYLASQPSSSQGIDAATRSWWWDTVQWGHLYLMGKPSWGLS